ncbi:MAG: hypothetical protein EZS28_049996 [Streblomastix strix]|uniref:Uncharacterized protein n=1 Tax=Streblomastix strix TaxID=222440 RepID=A0A5J4T898_9EUKA|nr:MAG: hypothetical protein EZS28_049996 [Streblomastix strix]
MLELEYKRCLSKEKEVENQKQKAQMPLTNKVRATMPKLKQKQLLQFQNLRLHSKEAGKKPNKLNTNQKTLAMRMNWSRVPDRAGTLQPGEISVEISLWNRGEERADEDGSSGDEGKDWRINKLEENKMIIPFRGMKEEKEAYQEMFKDELEEGIVIFIQQEQQKWWNHAFLTKNPNEIWRNILNVSQMNKEIEKLDFKIHDLEEIQYLATQMDYATSIDFKPAFHHKTFSPNSIPYLAFNFNKNNYAYKAMTFGTKHSSIFFVEAIESIIRQR